MADYPDDVFPIDNVLTVEPVPSLSDEINRVRKDTAEIMSDYIIPHEAVLFGSEGDDPRLKARKEAEALVRAKGLWAPHLPKKYGGSELGFLGLAYMNEILAWSGAGNSCFGIIAPNSGTAHVLVNYGTEEQKEKWLKPLLEGETQSGFSMTEPETAGSNPRSIITTAARDGDEWVINGRKWFTSNGVAADWLLVMCRTEDADSASGDNEKMTQIIVPKDTPGVTIERRIPVWGHVGGEVQIVYDNVRVPLENQLGARGSGHAAAQDRLGAGRVFHCLNSVGQMWRAFDIMVKHMTEREVHGGLQETKQFLQGFIADSYMDIQASRLMCIRCAELIDRGMESRVDISAIKVFVPNAYHRVVDRCIQVLGAKGVTDDTPVAGMYTAARTLRIADGPDEVHKILIAKSVLRRYHEGRCWDFSY